MINAAPFMLLQPYRWAILSTVAEDTPGRNATVCICAASLSLMMVACAGAAFFAVLYASFDVRMLEPACRATGQQTRQQQRGKLDLSHLFFPFYFSKIAAPNCGDAEPGYGAKIPCQHK